MQGFRNLINITSIFLFILLWISPARTDGSEEWLQGYQKTIAGGTIEYNSPQPDVTSALLLRSLDSADFISWRSQAIPENHAGDLVTFIWIFGMDVDTDPHVYNLSVENRLWFQFSNPTTSLSADRVITGPGGSELRFRVTFTDRHDDVFGYASMTLPKNELPLGRPLTIKVTGESAGSRVWYMTFQSQVIAGIKTVTQPALIKKENRLLQPVEVHIIHLGEPVKASLYTPGAKQVETFLQYGFNLIPMLFPETKQKVIIPLSVNIQGQEVVKQDITLSPVKKWLLYLVQNTHTDIGYTRPQSEILPDHLRFIDYALDYCDQTDTYPDAARFRWTCESSWAVSEYLNSRPPEQVSRLRQRVKQGRIELTGLYFNLSEMADENLLAAALRPLRLFFQSGFKVVTAMQNDINGIAWCLADYFSDLGIKYLSMGQHGHRARIPFAVPTSFWWESPAGKRILAFRSDHYSTGNFWGIHTGNFPSIERELLLYLQNLSADNYPYDRIAVQYSGYFTDNSPPSLTGSKLIKRWNEKYAWPKLRSATAGEFLQYMADNHGPELPVFQTAWPDWWSDGFGSSSRETAAARRTQSDLIAIQGLLALAFIQGATIPHTVSDKIDKIEKALLFWDEHTMGAAESISDPWGENSMVQWAEKSAYAWEAVKETHLLHEAAMGLLQDRITRTNTPSITVFNTMNWIRSGPINIYIDHEIAPRTKTIRFVDGNGKTIPAQRAGSRADGTFWYLWTEDIPSFGYKSYRIEVSSRERTSPPPAHIDGLLENTFYRMQIDPESGLVISLLDKQSNRELVDLKSQWRLGQLIHETIPNRSQLEQFRIQNHSRTAWGDLKIEKIEDGAVWKSITLSGTTRAAMDGTRPTCEIRLYNSTKRIELHFTLSKKDTYTPEALYVAFPFKHPHSEIVYEIQGGEVNPNQDQLEGTSSDWHAIQNYIAVRSPESQIIFSSPEIPLVHLGDLNLGKFSYRPNITRPYIFSWVMNNYWVTNFRASQKGEFKWSYVLTSCADNSKQNAARFGWESRIPLLGRIFHGRTSADNPPAANSGLKINKPNLLLISARPAVTAKGLLLHLREINNQDTEFSVTSPISDNTPLILIPVNVLEQSLGDPTQNPHLKPLENRFFLVLEPAGRK